MRLSVLCCTGPFCWFTGLWNFRVNFLLKQWKSVYPWLSCLNSFLLLIRCYSENFVKTLHSDVTIGRKRWAYIFLTLIVALRDVPKKARFLCVVFLRWISLAAILPSHGCIFLLSNDFFAFPSDRFNFKTCCSNKPWSSIRFMTPSWITTPFCCMFLNVPNPLYSKNISISFCSQTKIWGIPEFGGFL